MRSKWRVIIITTQRLLYNWTRYNGRINEVHAFFATLYNLILGLDNNVYVLWTHLRRAISRLPAQREKSILKILSACLLQSQRWKTDRIMRISLHGTITTTISVFGEQRFVRTCGIHTAHVSVVTAGSRITIAWLIARRWCRIVFTLPHQEEDGDGRNQFE